jgi:hypothetical protein
MRRLACLATAFVLAALPAAAAAQSLLTTPQIGPSVQTVTTPVTTSSNKGSGGGLSTATEIGIFAFGIGLIAVIAVIILSDARRKAPVPERDEREVEAESMVKHHKQIKQRRRAQGRDAKRQRKKNRPK